MKGPLQIQHIKLIHWTIGLIVSLSQVICQEECPENYFGPNCRFRCNYCQPRCSPEECGKNICARGFFGYLCQYRDLATHWGVPITIYNDGDETTCQTNDSVTTATIPFQATRITFFIFTIDSSSEANLIDDITFELLEGNDKRVCDEGNYSYYLTPFSKYFRCITIVNVTSMLLKGRGVTRLCTVSVSGGRNLAINQQYNYSSLYKNSDGDKGGVDGKIPLTGYINTKTCFQAAENSFNSSFFVIFNIRVLVDYFIVYNRPDVPNRNKILGFRLITYEYGNRPGFNFKENNRPPEGSGNYTIFNPWPSNAIYMFELLKYDTANNVLQFCEVEAWGECLQGEYGLDCTNKCNSKCRELYCEVTGKCVGCLSGFWGVECTKVCSSGCANKACNQEEGNCTHGCQTGLFSPNCTKECHNCMNNGKCSIDEGHCQDGCLKGFEPPSCENVCPAGTFGVDCKESCPPNCLDNCSPDEGKCNSTCSNGYFGENCEKVCNDGCFNNMCHRDNGSCMACDTGFFSEDCSRTCSDKCLNKTCHRNSGTCVACPEGFFSEDCSRSCKKGCLKGECNHENGACFACDPMYYSSDCSQACSESCAGKRCDQDKGTCLGCNPGYYLSDCSQKCNNGCLNGLCYQENGSCVACESQFYSSDCSKECSNNCGGSGECNMDGKCTSGCLNNSYGFDCSQECKGHCKNQTQCQQEDGSCPTGCEEGYSGMKCDSVGCEKGDSGTNCDNAEPRKLSNGSMVCSVNCLNKTCHPVTGSCTLGCVKGFGDVNCSTSCANCLNQACERKTAICVDGCIVGFTGQDCSFAQTEADSGLLPESQSWLWFTLLLIAMIGLMNIFLTIFLKRNAAAMKEETGDK